MTGYHMDYKPSIPALVSCSVRSWLLLKKTQYFSVLRRCYDIQDLTPPVSCIRNSTVVSHNHFRGLVSRFCILQYFAVFCSNQTYDLMEYLLCYDLPSTMDDVTRHCFIDFVRSLSPSRCKLSVQVIENIKMEGRQTLETHKIPLQSPQRRTEQADKPRACVRRRPC